MSLFKLEPFSCPICGVVIGPYVRGITFHARTHDVSSQHLYDLVFKITTPPLCVCSESCPKLTKWRGWDHGYDKYVKGHYDTLTRVHVSRISMLSSSHWSRGKTKDLLSSLKSAATKTSETLKNRYLSGDIKQWAKGLNVNNHQSIASRSNLIKGNRYRLYDYDKLISLLNEKLELRFDVLSNLSTLDLGRDVNTELTITICCTRCKTSYELSLYNIIRKTKQYCQSCDAYTSKFESEIGNFIESLGCNLLRRTKVGGREIDLLIKNSNFGVECNGLYWHSDIIQQNKLAHQQKTETCISAGIRLFHVFEDEWYHKRPIVEGMIRARLGLNEKIYARRCVIKQMSPTERKVFFEQNHIDGDVRSTICFGLYNVDNRLVSALSLRYPRNKKEFKTLEIARYASLTGFTITGGLGKLLAATKRWMLMQDNKFEKIMTYVDMRHGDGHGYEAVGFSLSRITPPRFWWTDKVHRYDRMKFRAKDNMSESTIANHFRVNKIYGCSNKVYYSSL